jgi:hypothetical protein
VTQTGGATLAISASTTLSGGTHSGTNTGDNAVNSLYSGLVTNATHTGDVTGADALTIADGVVTEAKCNSSINASLDLADSSIQPGTSLDPTNLATGSGAISLTAGGTNQDISLTPSGTGRVKIPNGIIEANNSLYGIAIYNGGTLLFYVNTSNVTQVGGLGLRPRTDGGSALGCAPTGGFDGGWSDLFLHTSAGVRWNNDTSLTRHSSGVVQVNTVLKIAPTTLASQPTAATAGDGAFCNITDGATTTLGATATGSGSLKQTLRSDGTDWRVMFTPV